MAKRFLDTNIWNKKWIRELDPKLKLFWIYLMSKCDHAGIYDVDVELASFQLKVDLTEKEILKAFNGNIKIIKTDKWFIPKFIEFQYGTLNDKVNAHRSAIDILKKHKLINDNKELINTSSSVKDKNINIVKEEKQDREKKFNDLVLNISSSIKPIPNSDVVKEFIYYWSESNSSGKKMRFEMEKTWDVKRRLEKWIRNSEQWGKNGISAGSNQYEKFKLDHTGNARIGYCTKCNESDFYDKFKIHYEDSRCCKVKLIPNREKNENKNNR